MSKTRIVGERFILIVGENTRTRCPFRLINATEITEALYMRPKPVRTAFYNCSSLTGASKADRQAAFYGRGPGRCLLLAVNNPTGEVTTQRYQASVTEQAA